MLIHWLTVLIVYNTYMHTYTERVAFLPRRLAGMKLAETISQIDVTTRSCIPVNVSKRGLSLLWLAQASQTPQEDPAEYSCTPLESVAALLADIRARDMEEPTHTDEFAWWFGGVVPKCSSKPIYRAIEAVDMNVRQRLRHGNHVHFVYDLVPPTTSLQNLKFVLNAARAPLRGVSNTEFKEVYGLSKTLKFKDAEPREVTPSDLWSTLY